jgi:hypothetical protein
MSASTSRGNPWTRSASTTSNSIRSTSWSVRDRWRWRPVRCPVWWKVNCLPNKQGSFDSPDRAPPKFQETSLQSTAHRWKPLPGWLHAAHRGRSCCRPATETSALERSSAARVSTTWPRRTTNDWSHRTRAALRWRFGSRAAPSPWTVPVRLCPTAASSPLCCSNWFCTWRMKLRLSVQSPSSKYWRCIWRRCSFFRPLRRGREDEKLLGCEEECCWSLNEFFRRKFERRCGGDDNRKHIGNYRKMSFLIDFWGKLKLGGKLNCDQYWIRVIFESMEGGEREKDEVGWGFEMGIDVLEKSDDFPGEKFDLDFDADYGKVDRISMNSIEVCGDLWWWREGRLSDGKTRDFLGHLSVLDVGRQVGLGQWGIQLKANPESEGRGTKSKQKRRFERNLSRRLVCLKSQTALIGIQWKHLNQMNRNATPTSWFSLSNHRRWRWRTRKLRFHHVSLLHFNQFPPKNSITSTQLPNKA